MLKRDDSDLGEDARGAAVLDRPLTGTVPPPSAAPTRGERLAALAAEDEAAPRAARQPAAAPARR